MIWVNCLSNVFRKLNSLSYLSFCEHFVSALNHSANLAAGYGISGPHPVVHVKPYDGIDRKEEGPDQDFSGGKFRRVFFFQFEVFLGR